nr:hypothetical protein [Salmonid herpesvirus 1]
MAMVTSAIGFPKIRSQFRTVPIAGMLTLKLKPMLLIEPDNAKEVVNQQVLMPTASAEMLLAGSSTLNFKQKYVSLFEFISLWEKTWASYQEVVQNSVRGVARVLTKNEIADAISHKGLGFDPQRFPWSFAHLTMTSEEFMETVSFGGVCTYWRDQHDYAVLACNLTGTHNVTELTKQNIHLERWGPTSDSSVVGYRLYLAVMPNDPNTMHTCLRNFPGVKPRAILSNLSMEEMCRRLSAAVPPPTDQITYAAQDFGLVCLGTMVTKSLMHVYQCNWTRQNAVRWRQTTVGPQRAAFIPPPAVPVRRLRRVP